MLEAGRKAFAAAKAKDVPALEALNDELYQSCVTCHSTSGPATASGRGRSPRLTARWAGPARWRIRVAVGADLVDLAADVEDGLRVVRLGGADRLLPTSTIARDSCIHSPPSFGRLPSIIRLPDSART